ncbi:zinc-binding dehydrogenase [Paenibacillus thailandensis]|uniref:Zinc-binding dehydrogenase n=1 Tax=Paenibacillus thailandensis TaxID=393250 RepID=A0ABW5R5R3_9BACL
MNAAKALLLKNKNDLGLTNVPLREPEPDELLIRVRYAALCGSDYKLYQGTYTAPHAYPVILGHEWVGTVERIGSRAGSIWRKGDAVTGDCSLFCGECEACRTDKNHCLHVEKRGITVDGACAEYILVKEKHLYLCPPSADPIVYSLAEPMAVVVQSLQDRIPSEAMRGVRRVLIIGSGGIGALSLFSFLDLGIPEIVIADPAADKLAVIDRLPFPEVRTLHTDLNGRDDPRNGFDLIVEASGSGQALKQAIELLKPRGILVNIGHQGPIELPYGEIVKKSLTVIGSIGGTGGFHKAIELIRKYEPHIRSFISKVVPMRDVPRYFQTGVQSSKHIKVVIDLQG